MNTPIRNAPAPASPAPRPIRAAASLIVLRDGEQGLEVLMLRRADKPDDQNSGASVFPGGVLDAHDRQLHTRCAGLDDAAASERLEVAEGGLDYYAAAVRECFEEAGILFACDAGDRLVALDGMPAERLAAMRGAAAEGTDALLALCDAQGWRLAVDRLAYFSHWLTPPGMPRRFDTRFFVAAMPPGQSVRVDGVEIVEHQWLRPAEAASPARGLKLMNVTRRVLEELAGFDSLAACLADIRGRTRIRRTMPRLADGPKGRRPVNMEEAAYDEIGLVDPDGRGGGRYALEAGLVMQLSPRIRRVAGAAPDAHSYFVGAEDGGWVLIDPMPMDSAHAEALRAAAPGRVRWLLSTQGAVHALAAWPEAQALQPSMGDELKLGGVTLRVLAGAPAEASATGGRAMRFLLMEERTLFAGVDATMAAFSDHPGEAIEWIAPGHGFMTRRRAD